MVAIEAPMPHWVLTIIVSVAGSCVHAVHHPEKGNRKSVSSRALDEALTELLGIATRVTALDRPSEKTHLHEPAIAAVHAVIERVKLWTKCRLTAHIFWISQLVLRSIPKIFASSYRILTMLKELKNTKL